jgi:hypothetical protein
MQIRARALFESDCQKPAALCLYQKLLAKLKSVKVVSQEIGVRSLLCWQCFVGESVVGHVSFEVGAVAAAPATESPLCRY